MKAMRRTYFEPAEARLAAPVVPAHFFVAARDGMLSSR
jgi:hypothetical protein